MFSYNFKMRKLANPIGNLHGFCDLVVDDIMVVKGFKILQSKAGEFFAVAPSQVSDKVDEAGNKQWFPTTYFIDQKDSDDAKRTPVESEILTAIVKEFVGTQTATSKPDTNSRPTATKTAKKASPWNQ